MGYPTWGIWDLRDYYSCLKVHLSFISRYIFCELKNIIEVYRRDWDTCAWSVSVSVSVSLIINWKYWLYFDTYTKDTMFRYLFYPIQCHSPEHLYNLLYNITPVELHTILLKVIILFTIYIFSNINFILMLAGSVRSSWFQKLQPKDERFSLMLEPRLDWV